MIVGNKPNFEIPQSTAIFDPPELAVGCLSSVSSYNYHKTSNISRTLVGNKIVDNSDVVGASLVSTAPTTSSFST